jgi:hypothetical protein
MSRSKIDPIHIQQYVFDEETESLKVKLIPIEMSIELDANDGDSVKCYPAGFNFSDKNQPYSCVGMKTAMLYKLNEQDLKLEVSPFDSGDIWVEVSNPQNPCQICARRIRMTGNGSGVVVVQAV